MEFGKVSDHGYLIMFNIGLNNDTPFYLSKKFDGWKYKYLS